MVRQRCRSTVYILVVLLGGGTPTLHADTPDYDAVSRYTKRLKDLGLKAVPVYSVAPNKGVIGSNAAHVYGQNLRALYPDSYIVRTVAGSKEVALKEKIQAGWQPFQSHVETPSTWAMVNVGWSPIQIDDLNEKLRPGEFVYLREGKLVKGSVRDPERVRTNEDILNDAAAEMMTEFYWYNATKNRPKAIETLQAVARQYPQTTAGSRATAMLEQLVAAKGPVELGKIDQEAVPETVFKKTADETDDERAAHLLDMAKFALKLNQYGKAQMILQGLTTHYPRTRYATTGHELLTSLTNASVAKTPGRIDEQRPRE